MSIPSVSVVLPAVASTGVISLTNAVSSSVPAADTASSASGDTVTFSPTSQQGLATGAVVPPDSSADPAALTQAIAALNDTSGTVSIDDQLQAHGFAANFVQGPQVAAFEADFVPGQSAAFPQQDYNTAKGDATVALID